MLQLLTCSKGHSWEAAADDGAAVARAVCPVCGEAVATLPLFDLAPAPEVDTPIPQPVYPEAPPLRDEAGMPVVAGFAIQEDLGRTPLGVRLFKAKQVLVNRIVLLKVVVAREDVGQTGWGALRGEAAALGRIIHPNIAPILEAGERERQLFYNAVEWVDGPTLAEHAAGKPMAPRTAALLIEALARAVHAAHDQGVIHRGLRPSCIHLQPVGGGKSRRNPAPVEPPFWLTEAGSRCLPRIGDFGLARRPVEGDPADVELHEGMPCYLAPEQAWGRTREIGAVTDVYALGAILYELLTGRPPFRGRTPGETLDFIRAGDPPSLLRQLRPPTIDLVSICRKAMMRNPRNRYQSALEMAEDLRAFSSFRPVKAQPANVRHRGLLWMRRRPTAALLLLVCVLAAAGALTAYLIGAAGTAAATQETELAQSRAKSAQDREGGLLKDLTESQGREKTSAYYHRILLASRELEANHNDRARQLLDKCPPDLRHWEWRYLDQLDGAGALPGLGGRGVITHTPLTGAELAVASTSFSPDGRQLAAATGTEFDDKWEVRIWDLASLEKSRVLGLRFPIHRIAFSPDGTRLATASSRGNAGEATEGNLAQGQATTPLNLRGSAPTDVAYSPDGSRLLVVDSRGRVHVFTKGARNESPLNIVTGGDWQDRDFCLAVLSQDGTKFAVVAAQGTTVQIYDTQSSRTAIQATQHADQITALTFNAETNLLASASRDGTAKVWDVRANRLVCTLQGHIGAVTGVAFTRDGRRLATVGDDFDVRIWDPATGQEILKLTPFDKEKPRGNGVTGLAFNPAKDAWQLAAAHGTDVVIFGPPRH